MNDHDADDLAWKLLQERAKRGLGSRPRMRVLASALWPAFLGAAAMISSFLLIMPPDSQNLSLEWLSGFFFLAWASGFASALISIVLYNNGHRRNDA
jgi:hypothetical protein